MQCTLRQKRYNISTFSIYESTIDRRAKSYQMSLANPADKVCFLIAIKKNIMQMSSITRNVKKYGVA